MIWQDLYIDQRPDDARIIQATADLFGVRPAAVHLFGEYAELLSTPPGEDVRVMVERLPVEGEFKLRLGFFPRHSEQEAIVTANNDEDLLQRFCELLGVRGLMEDRSDHPDGMLLLEPSKAPRSVYLDVDRLDDHEEYVIARQSVTTAD